MIMLGSATIVAGALGSFLLRASLVLRGAEFQPCMQLCMIVLGSATIVAGAPPGLLVVESIACFERG